MKVLVCVLTICLAPIVAQDNRAHFSTRTASFHMGVTADTMLREDPPAPHASPYAALIHLKGNVEIKTCCVELPPGTKGSKKIVTRQYMIMHADEADFREDTGEIEPRGNVRVRFETAR